MHFKIEISAGEKDMEPLLQSVIDKHVCNEAELRVVVDGREFTIKPSKYSLLLPDPFHATMLVEGSAKEEY